MPTVYRRSTSSFSNVLTNRLISIPTSPATKVTLTSGAKAMYVTNIGPSTIVWGDTSITAGSGNFLFYSVSEVFNPMQGDGFIFFIADSAQGTISVNEII